MHLFPLLLDTSVFIRLTSDPGTIPKALRERIDRADRRILSIVSVWEIAVKSAIGKLTLPLSADEWIRSRTERLLVDLEPGRFEHAVSVEHLPLYHRDPFDRLLIAHAVVENYAIDTDDRYFKKYAVHVLPAWK